MAELQRLQFSIGPVQGFVAQSRRTRDLWASSFLLSHLAAVAIERVCELDGAVVLPAWDDDAKKSVREHDFGTVPNRFAADFTDVASATVAADAARATLLEQWRKVADQIWSCFVVEVANLGYGTKAIWDRQVANFWEISWVIGSPGESDKLLAARKNWRTTPATVEPGDHCTLMSDRQELSGWIRSQGKGKQETFWKKLREQHGIGKLDLAEDERLCAISLIKRMFPKVANQVLGRDDIESNRWPSTAYVAAIPWLLAVASNPKTQDAARKFAQQVRKVAKNSLGERQTRIPRLQLWKQDTRDFLSLDGNFFQKNAIVNARITPLDVPQDRDADERKKLAMALGELADKVNQKPSAFYAVLLMDGDSMGALLGDARKLAEDGEQRATSALSQFSRSVPNIISEDNGITIYAGGDDVLAMLPLSDALPCAIKIVDAYQNAFAKQFSEPKAIQLRNGATLSGAIVYAHYHTPLRDVLTTAHHLLDDIAKDATGRDSLAIGVFKSSGINAQWSAPWKHIREDESGKLRADGKCIIDDLVDSLKRTDAGRPGEFSSGFLYNVRDRFAALTDNALSRPGEFGKLSEDLQRNSLFERVLEADYLRGLSHRGGEEVAEQNKDKATEAIQRLLKLCQRVTRKNAGIPGAPDYRIVPEPDSLGIDGALLVRFLASEGKEDSE